MAESLSNSRITSSIESMRSSIERIMPPPPPSTSASSISAASATNAASTPPFSPNQLQWLDNHLSKFRSELLHEINERVTSSRQRIVDNDETDLISLVENESTSLENKVQRLFSLIIEARLLKRSLKAAYLEEELQSTG